MKRQEQSRREFIDGLMAVGRFYEQNPEAYYDGLKMTLSMYVGGKESANALAATARAFGRCKKSCDGQYAAISKQFGKMVSVELFALRSEVCRRVVLGARVEPALVIPATKEARIPESVVEIVGWICDPLLVCPASPPRGLKAAVSNWQVQKGVTFVLRGVLCALLPKNGTDASLREHRDEKSFAVRKNHR